MDFVSPARPDEIAMAKEDKHCPRCNTGRQDDQFDYSWTKKTADDITNAICKCNNCGFSF